MTNHITGFELSTSVVIGTDSYESEGRVCLNKFMSKTHRIYVLYQNYNSGDRHSFHR
jgi:hypothetical protein